MMQEIDIVINKSKIYFIPIFNEIVKISYFNLLRNSYFWYDSFYEETFCLLYKFDGKVRGNHNKRSGFTVYERDGLMNHKLFKGYRDYNDYVIYEFSLTDELLEYRDLLLTGKYSKISEEYKTMILNFNLRMYGPNEREYIRKVLYKDESLLEELSKKYNEPKKDFPEAIAIINPERELFANFVIEKELKK